MGNICIDLAFMLKKPPIINEEYNLKHDEPHQQREGDSLPNDPGPKQRGGRPYVHRAAPPSRKPQSEPVNNNSAKKAINVFRRPFHQLIPSLWQKSWSANIVHLVRPSL